MAVKNFRTKMGIQPKFSNQTSKNKGIYRVTSINDGQDLWDSDPMWVIFSWRIVGGCVAGSIVGSIGVLFSDLHSAWLISARIWGDIMSYNICIYI
jgi:hypothetical protein